MQKVPVHEATAEQLRQYAANVLGLDIHPNAKRETILARIMAVTGDALTEIDVDEGPDADLPVGAPPQPATTQQHGPTPGKVRVIINTVDEPGGSEPVPLSVNGRAMLVPRGRQVDIPSHYFEVLKNATKMVYDPSPEPEGGLLPPRIVPMYPYQRIA